MSSSDGYPRPPRLAEWLLGRMFPDLGYQTPLGDLAELYGHLASTHGEARARLWYWMQVFRAVDPFLLDKWYWGTMMFKNYLLIALRNLGRQKVYTSVNVLGLALAIACGVLTYAFVRSEMTHDTFHAEHESIYRVTPHFLSPEMAQWDRTPYPLATEAETQIPGVEATTRLTAVHNKLLRVDNQLTEQHVHLAGPAFFDIFDFELERGKPGRVLEDPRAVVISKTVQETYFPGRNPEGEHLSINLQGDTYTDFTIRGVAVPIPDNSSIRFDFLLSERVYSEIFDEQWMTACYPWSLTATFLKAYDSATPEALQAGVEQIASAQELGIRWNIEEAPVKLPLQRFADVHLDKEVQNVVLAPAGDVVYSYILAAVAILVLLIACINFTNLAVGVSTTRAKEVGMRKVLGAEPGQVMRQFWSESCLLSLLALGLGLGLAHAFLPTFNELAGKNLVLDYYRDWKMLAALLGLAVGVALLSGSYPAVVLSRFRPAAVLKGTLRLNGKNVLSRAMISFQFAASIVLIACTLLMSSQLRHLSQHDLGYEADLLVYQRLLKPADEATVERYRFLAMQNPGVTGLTATQAGLTGDDPSAQWAFMHDGELTMVSGPTVDHDFVDVMSIDLVAGRNFSPDHPGDATESVLVNEAFLRSFGVEEPIGRPLPFAGGNLPTIVGVVKDFHFQSLRKNIEPLLLHLDTSHGYGGIFTRIRADRMSETLAHLEDAWDGTGVGTPFEFAFFDSVIQHQYESERRYKAVGAYISYFAILIACLGLFGLTALSVARRTREMGVRKVLGASAGRVLLLFYREYLVLLLVASLVAWPVAYYLMTQWLSTFAFRIEIGPGMFVLAGLIVSALTLLTITVRALGTAYLDPAKVLQYE